MQESPTQQTCYHCGDACTEHIKANGLQFCCNGCRQVYLLLQENGLCGYYDLQQVPGIKVRGRFAGNRFNYLDDETMQKRLSSFNTDTQVNIIFSLPQIHCSSCIFLLEQLNKIEPGIISSQTNFERKEIFISYDPRLISLKKLVQLLAFVGYEPDINQEASTGRPKRSYNRGAIAALGVAGFCFSNIMMLSFPEYFSGGEIEEPWLKQTFSYIILALSIPVLLYSSAAIFKSAFKGLRQGMINIDAPIALAILMGFGRSYYEIITGTGAGYLDSATGIVFFMLVGRWFQNKTYNALSFDRQYKSYFPLGVSVINNNKEENIPVTRLKIGDRIVIRNEEMVPADAVLLEGKACIDYSFVTGEQEAVRIEAGAMVQAGGKQKGSAVYLRVVKEPSQSYITQLWNNDIFSKEKNQDQSFIHPWSRYFTAVLLSIAFLTALFWAWHDPSKLLTAVTAVLIVACPCSLLLSATFTYGNMLRIFGRNKLFLKNAAVIEAVAGITDIVFDKTGTITQTGKASIQFKGQPLSIEEREKVRQAATQSAHSLSKALAGPYESSEAVGYIDAFEELPGEGLTASWGAASVKLGSNGYVRGLPAGKLSTAAEVHVKIDDAYRGYYEIQQVYRPGMGPMAADLLPFNLHVLSGDNDSEKANLQHLFGTDIPMKFAVSPQQKLNYVKELQGQHASVMMLGDGLNDAGALKQANAGIAISNDAARFTPACDAIMDGTVLHQLGAFIRFAKSGRAIVLASFILSILYNIIGLSFAVQAKLSPVVAAILMPASSISIILFVTLCSSAVAHRLGLGKN